MDPSVDSDNLLGELQDFLDSMPAPTTNNTVLSKEPKSVKAALEERLRSNQAEKRKLDETNSDIMSKTQKMDNYGIKQEDSCNRTRLSSILDTTHQPPPYDPLDSDSGKASSENGGFKTESDVKPDLNSLHGKDEINCGNNNNNNNQGILAQALMEKRPAPPTNNSSSLMHGPMAAGMKSNPETMMALKKLTDVYKNLQPNQRGEEVGKLLKENPTLARLLLRLRGGPNSARMQQQQQQQQQSFQQQSNNPMPNDMNGGGHMINQQQTPHIHQQQQHSDFNMSSMNMNESQQMQHQRAMMASQQQQHHQQQQHWDNTMRCQPNPNLYNGGTVITHRGGGAIKDGQVYGGGGGLQQPMNTYNGDHGAPPPPNVWVGHNDQPKVMVAPGPPPNYAAYRNGATHMGYPPNEFGQYGRVGPGGPRAAFQQHQPDVYGRGLAGCGPPMYSPNINGSAPFNNGGFNGQFVDYAMPPNRGSMDGYTNYTRRPFASPTIMSPRTSLPNSSPLAAPGVMMPQVSPQTYMNHPGEEQQQRFMNNNQFTGYPYDYQQQQQQQHQNDVGFGQEFDNNNSSRNNNELMGASFDSTDPSSVVEDEWKTKASDLRANLLQRLQEALKEQGNPDAFSVAENVERDVFNKSQTRDDYTLKLAHWLASIYEGTTPHQQDFPDSTTLQDTLSSSTDEVVTADIMGSNSESDQKQTTATTRHNPLLADLLPKANKNKDNGDQSCPSPTSSSSSSSLQSCSMTTSTATPSSSLTTNCTSSSTFQYPAMPPSLDETKASVGTTTMLQRPGGGGRRTSGKCSQQPPSSSQQQQQQPVPVPVPVVSATPVVVPAVVSTAVNSSNNPHSVDSGIGSPRSIASASSTTLYSPKIQGTSPSLMPVSDNSPEKNS